MLKELSDYLKFNKEIEQESDRGFALLIYSQLDHLVQKLLQKRLVKNTKLLKQIFSGTQLLATSSARINLAFLLGLIGKDVFDDFGILRKIRNDFAHNFEAITFDNSKIQKLCNSLKVTTKPKENSGRKKFLNIQLISHIILQQLRTLEPIKQMGNFDHAKLLSDLSKDKELIGFNELEEKVRSGKKLTKEDFSELLSKMTKHFKTN